MMFDKIRRRLARAIYPSPAKLDNSKFAVIDNTADQIVELSKVFAVHTHRAETTVSRLATGSWDSIERLQAGKSITTRRAEKTIQWFSDNWPDDLCWPEDIVRPEKKRKAA
ncbi:MAG: hypothetical protein QM488_12685 [Rhizobiaceae bacterium]